MLKRINKTQTRFEHLMTMLPEGFAVTVRLPRAVPTLLSYERQKSARDAKIFPFGNLNSPAEPIPAAPPIPVPKCLRIWLD
jgi:hypothetical protein